MPALRALRRWAHAEHPDAEVVLACPHALTPLVDLAGLHLPGRGRAPLVDRVLDVDAKDASGLLALDAAWRASYDRPPLTAVNLHGSGPASHRVLTALRPEHVAAFDCPEAGVAGPPWHGADGEEHEVHRWCRLVESALAVSADPADLLLEPPARRAGPTSLVAAGAVVVHPGAAHPSRRWPTDRWAAVARAVAQAGHRVVITGGTAELPLAREVCRLAGLPPQTVLAGRTDLAELAALVADARLVVCGDTGTAHLASAFRTPSVVLFGPVPPARWGPPQDGPHTVLWHGGASEGDPWGAEPDPALLQVTVEEVLEAVLEALQLGGAAQRVPGA